MNYAFDRNGRKISRLGYGCMRFTRKGGMIDHRKAEKEILHALELGVNYYDTAYVYPGSEKCLGRILHDGRCRDAVSIATKLPQYLVRTESAMEAIFRKQLARLRTDRIDYYLMHMFTDLSEWERLQTLRIEEWIRRHKAGGEIGSIGFSFHGDTGTFLRILDAYDWDLCQIQYNYLDENSQAGRAGLQAAAARGVPVVIMEPLRGGRLVHLPVKARRELEKSGKGCSPAELGLRWLWDQPEVTCVLSGMNSLEMIDENARIASQTVTGGCTAEDLALVERIRGIIREREKVPCTGCRYCMPCPHGVDIPGIFHYYNLMHMEGKGRARIEFARNIGLRRDAGFASRCAGCGRCEAHCPQHIRIPEMLKQADADLRPLLLKIGIAAARRFMGR